jgi:predicted RND superfamily exporter protein
MFEFVFSKKPTIMLLLLVIFVSLVFSVLFNIPLQEGIDEEDSINNPPPNIIEKINEKLNNSKLSNIEKLVEIKSIIKRKYKVLSDIFKKNESSILQELQDYLSKPPKMNSEGKPVDEYALIGDKRAAALKIISSNDYSAIEKIEKLKVDSDKDMAVNNILNEYITSWIKMIQDNIEKLTYTSNDIIVPIPSP